MGNGDEFVLFLLESGFNVRQLDGPTDFGLELFDFCAVRLQAKEAGCQDVGAECGKTNQSANPWAK